jgi:UDP-N-acetylglucosamine--N-acetylmuramyl-(pentapeptide) pyrophosphoryl-undecaprenol N-acetylglucosamine transferase
VSAPLLVIAAGGTGGHLFPAQALAEEMLSRGWRVHLATDDRGLRYAGGFPDEVERVRLRSATLARGGLTDKLAAPVAIARGVLSAVLRFRRDPPAVVAGFGGYPAIPALAAAWMLGRPRLIHEQNGVLGRVNRLFARRVNRVACGIWPVARAPAGAPLQPMGNPVRRAVAAAARTPYEVPGDWPLRLVAFGGSQGARVFSTLVPAAVALLPEVVRHRLTVTQQVGEIDADAVAQAFAQAGVRADLAPFFADMPERIAAAHLVVCRAGASTIAELSAIGRPAILVPYPSAMDDHQTANARALADTGAAILAPEAGLTPETLAAHLRAVLLDPVEAGAMAERAASMGRTDAARRLADLVADLGCA